MVSLWILESHLIEIMRDSTIAKRFSEFRYVYGLSEDSKNIKTLYKYYRAMIEAHQVFPVIRKEKKRDLLTGLIEWWWVTEEDAKRIRNKKEPKSMSDGDIMYIANATINRAFHNNGMLHFFRKFLKTKFPDGKRVFWYNRRRNRYTKIFEVKRWQQQSVP